MPTTDDQFDPSVLLVTKGLDLGGIERVVVDLAVGLTRRGARVEVALVNSDRDRLVPALDEAGVTVHRLDGSDRIGVGAARRLARLVRSRDFAIVHVHGMLPAAIVRFVSGDTPVITTAHTPWTSLRATTRFAARLTGRRDAATIAVSAIVAASLPNTERVVVIPHGVDVARVNQVLNRTTDDGTLPKMAAITVASHRDAKNYPNLLRAVRIAVDSGAALGLLAIGDGDGLDVHRAMVHELDLDHVVRFEPPTEHVLDRIAESDVLVVASDYEGQPIVVAEALALGKPVIATAVGRVPEMVNPAVGRVVPPKDPVALGAALAELANAPETRAAMSKAAREQGLGWTLDDVLDAHQAIYRQVVDR